MNDITAAVAELAALIPALDAALERDHTPGTDEKVTATGPVWKLPVNQDVLRVMATLHGEIPATARWAGNILGETIPGHRDILDHLRHLPRMYERMVATNAADQARHLYSAGRDRPSGAVARWLRMVKTALGLRTVDRKLGQFCPLHDEVLVELVAPGDEGHLHHGPETTVSWIHTDAVLCRQCGASWTPGQYLLLGRLLRDADRRRVAPSAGERAA